jgi:hypothetical protein
MQFPWFRRSPLFIVAGAMLVCAPALAKPAIQSMARAADEFLTALTPEQRAKAVVDFQSEERFNWHFVPRARRGIAFSELSGAQQQRAQALLRSSLSERGQAKVSDIFTLEKVLHELEGQSALRDVGLYYITIFGQPGSAPWGWRLEGHHLSLNVTVGAQEVIALTPSFLGANPAEVRDGPHKGLRALAAEEDLARKLVVSLDAEQRKRAIIATNAPRDIITGAARKAQRLEPLGIDAAQLSRSQRKLLDELLREYVLRYRKEIAGPELKKIQAAKPEQLYFAWAGGLDRGQGHYYRIQGPGFLVEYDNTQNRANHIHTVWRDLENDFGEDALRKHYEQTPHSN